MCSRENTALLPLKFREKPEYFSALLESIYALIGPVEGLNIRNKVSEILITIEVDPLCVKTRKDDVVTPPEIMIVTVADDQTFKETDEIIPDIIGEGVLQDQEPDVAGASNSRELQKSKPPSTPPLPLKLCKKHEHIHALLESIYALIGLVEGLNIRDIISEILITIEVDPLCGKTRKDDVVTTLKIMILTVDDQTSKETDEIIPNITGEGVLKDQEPDVAGASNSRELQKSKAKQAEKTSENAEHAVSDYIHGGSALEAHLRKQMKMLKFKSIDHITTDILQLYANVTAKLMNIDKELDCVLDRFNEDKKFHVLLESLQIFDSKIQYNDDAFQEDDVKLYTCHCTFDKSAACASGSKGAIQSNVPTSDHEAICSRYIKIYRRINERVIEYTTRYKYLSSCKTSNIRIGNARINALVLNVDNYRGDCLARIMNILPILKLFEKYVERRYQDCNRVSFNYCDLAKTASNDAGNIERAKTIHSHINSLKVIQEILERKEKYLEHCKYMDQKKEEMIKQSIFLEFWGPESSPMNKDPNFIMTKTNSLIELSFEVFDSLRKIIFDLQHIKRLADSIAPET